MNNQKMIPLFKVFMPKTVIGPLTKTLFSGYIGQGPRVDEFEKALAKYIGNPYVVTLNSGTAAIHLALQLAQVKPGDEVISTPLTCTATNWPILAQGAKIVWADIDPATGNIDSQSIARKITPKTAAIMTVDWGGQPVDIAAIKKIAFKKINGQIIKIPVIEDAAHAFGSYYKNKKVGCWADFTCFSFMAIKNLTTADGGCLCVLDRKKYKKGTLLRWYGIDRTHPNRTSHVEKNIYEWGYKFHMNDIAATIGLEQLKYTEKNISKVRDNAAFFLKNLSGIKNLTLLKPQPYTRSCYWLFTVRVKNRPAFQKALFKKGIMSSPVHRRNDTHPVVSRFKTSLPNLDIFAPEMICIPVGWWVTKKQREYIVKSIKQGW